MLKQFLLDIKLHNKGFLVQLVQIPVCFLLGFGLCCLIMFTEEDPGTWVTCGTFFSFFGLLFFAILNFGKYYQEFMLALSMGRTRVAFLISYALRMLLQLAIGYCLILALYRLELALGNKLFAPWPLDGGPILLKGWLLIAAGLPVMVIISMFVGTLYSYFGKKALSFLWIVWMAVCLVGPRLLETEENSNVVSQALRSVPGWGWIAAGVVALVAMVATVIGLGKKQMVK